MGARLATCPPKRTGSDGQAPRSRNAHRHYWMSTCVDVIARMECQVVNEMDTGASTLFLGDVVSVENGRQGAVMTSEHFRAHMPPDKQAIYEARLETTHSKLVPLARNIKPRRHRPGPQVPP